jgi:hypothetical protein
MALCEAASRSLSKPRMTVNRRTVYAVTGGSRLLCYTPIKESSRPLVPYITGTSQWLDFSHSTSNYHTTLQFHNPEHKKLQPSRASAYLSIYKMCKTIKTIYLCAGSCGRKAGQSEHTNKCVHKQSVQEGGSGRPDKCTSTTPGNSQTRQSAVVYCDSCKPDNWDSE